MKYNNPIVKGFYPDPSVCFANGKYYMVCSSFQYFPGVPLFESNDLVNWTQIGHVLTRKNQIMLEKVNSSGGVFAPTIRFHNGRFYMVTTNDTTHQHFYVYTDDIHKEWSDPIYVDQNGIDPSLYFEGDKTYFMSNGSDDTGKPGVIQCEIDIETGKKLSPSTCIWQGSGGRYLESPHLYKIGDWYYLMAAEGGTEYGHMVTYARSSSVWGPFENYKSNPVLTNRNKAPYIIQGIGHGDLIRDTNGDWHILCLGFRQIHIWHTFHHLGREVFLIPVSFDQDGWFTAGNDETAEETYELKGDFEQITKDTYTFENTNWNLDWCFLRHPHLENYTLEDNKAILRGTSVTIDEADSPTFLAIRQRDFKGNLRCHLSIDNGEAGITIYMSELEHYDIAIRKNKEQYECVLKLNVGTIKHEEKVVPLANPEADLCIRLDNEEYTFSVKEQGKETILGKGMTRYLSSEVSGGFTGVLFGMYAIGEQNTATFTDFNCHYEENEPITVFA